MPVICLLTIYAVLIGLPIARWAILRPRSSTKAENHLRKQGDESAICEYCKYDARGLERCPECGRETRLGCQQRLARLRENWPTEDLTPRVPAAGEQPVVIVRTDDHMAAHLLAQHLEARGITALADESDKSYGGVGFSVLPACCLKVWTDDVERARAIVEKLWPEALWRTDQGI